MDETVRCVTEEGFAAVNAKYIAERAGVTWGVIQYHFGDRDGLLAAVVDSGLDDLRARMVAVDRLDGSTVERVTAVVHAAWAAFSSPTSRASLEILIATRGSRDPETNDHLNAMATEMTRIGRDLMGGGAGHADKVEVGELMWATLRGLVLTQMVVGQAFEPHRELAALVAALSTQLDASAADPAS